VSAKSTTSIMRNKDIAGVFVVAAAILMIPLVAMQFSDEWDWNLFDFVIIGTLLIGTGLSMVLAARNVKNIYHRAAIIIALLAALLLIWVELAVGIFD
jgi:uncharacterized membrane-anchored protein